MALAVSGKDFPNRPFAYMIPELYEMIRFTGNLHGWLDSKHKQCACSVLSGMLAQSMQTTTFP